VRYAISSKAGPERRSSSDRASAEIAASRKLSNDPKLTTSNGEGMTYENQRRLDAPILKDLQ